MEEISEPRPRQRGPLGSYGITFRELPGMLLSPRGRAVRSHQIDGVRHGFTTVGGVYEDVTDIVLNVKGLVFPFHGHGRRGHASISIDGPCRHRRRLKVPAGSSS